MLYKAFPAALKEATHLRPFQNSDLLARFVTYFSNLTFELQFIIDRNTQKLYLLYQRDACAFTLENRVS